MRRKTGPARLSVLSAAQDRAHEHAGKARKAEETWKRVQGRRTKSQEELHRVV
jgi:hypothetical protein